MTKTEISARIGVDHDHISTILNRLSKPGKIQPKRVYICGYVYDSWGERRYPRPVYQLGMLPNVKKPKRDIKETRRRYLQGLQKRMTMNSVFNLGLTRKEYTAVMRGRTEEALSA